jgi:hypothetical protein
MIEGVLRLTRITLAPSRVRAVLGGSKAPTMRQMAFPQPLREMYNVKLE